MNDFNEDIKYNSPFENSAISENNNKLSRIPRSLNYRANEVDDLKDRIKKLEENVQLKENFIRDLGDSKDEEAREFDKQKTRLLAKIKEINGKLSKSQEEVECVRTEHDFDLMRIKKLEEDLLNTEEKLRIEKETAELNHSLSDTNSFNESREKLLHTRLISTEKDLRICLDENAELQEKMEQMDSIYKDQCMELENMREINSSFRKDLTACQERILELESELHSLRVNPEIAKQGNSLFGEVIEGREKQEEEMRILFREKERFHAAYDRAMKMLHESTRKAEENYTKRDALAAPTLDIFKRIKKKLKLFQHENGRLKDRILALEKDILDTEIQQLNGVKDASVLISERRLQIRLIQDEWNSKKRLESQIRQLQSDNQELLDRIAAESNRASAVPGLEHRIEVLEKIIAQLEKDKNFT